MTEVEINEKSLLPFQVDPSSARYRLKKLMDRFEGNLEVKLGLTYLDVGCGNGDIAFALVEEGATTVTGIDIVKRQINLAQKYKEYLSKEISLDFVEADINTWESHQRFDVVLSNEALEHIAKPDIFLKRLSTLARSDGLIYLAF